MITVTVLIGSDERVMHDRSEIDEAWINQQINRRQADGRTICVKVHIETHGVNVSLGTPKCPMGPVRREANPQEREIIDLWDKCGLSREDFTGGNLVAFLKQLPCWR